MKLCECVWWPNTWETKDRQDIPREQLIADGLFRTCEVSAIGLIIEVEYHGTEVSGRVPQPSVNSPGNLYKLRDFLLDHSGASMTTIENWMSIAINLTVRD